MSRFAATGSPWKNQSPSPAKREAWLSELPLSSSVGDASNGLAPLGTCAIAPSSSKGSLAVLDPNKPGKYAQQISSFDAAAGDILDLHQAFHNVLAVSAANSTLNIFRLGQEISALYPPEHASTIHLESPATQVRFHPHAAGLVHTLAGSTVSVYDVESGSKALALSGPAKGLHSAMWSDSGREIASTSKDGMVQLWDPRASSEPQMTAIGHPGNKASRVAWIGDQVFSTGTSKTRDREYTLRDPRAFDKPIKIQRLDTGTGVLIPLIDSARKVVYLAGRGDMTLRWTEIVGSSQVFQEGSSPLPIALFGADLASSATLNVMHAEINRLYISSKDGVFLPVSVNVQRRQYLDFHADLFPLRRSEVAALDAPAWLAGENKTVELVSAQPGMKQPDLAPSPASRASAGDLVDGIEKVSIAAPVSLQTPVTAVARGAKEEQASNAEMHSKAPIPAANDLATVPNGAFGHMTRSNAASSHVAPASKTWSRNFLAGKTALRPDYEGLSGLAASSASDVQSLRANTKFLVFPLSGPGGRLGIHTLANRGRLPTLVPAVVTGQAIQDFAISPFDENLLLVAGGDGHVRLFRLPEGGLKEGQDMTEPESSFGGGPMERIIALRCHPTAMGLISTLSEDRGISTFRVWTIESGRQVLCVPLKDMGIFAMAWSHNGRFVALTCRDRRLRVLDPRSGEIVAVADSHRSSRPSRPLWLDDEQYILTTGFDMSSNRELRIYNLRNGALQPVTMATLDASPAPLVPFADCDTGIIWLWSRGDRSIRAYDFSTRTSLTALPTFEHGLLQQAIDFLPKRCVDAKAVEIAVAYRLTPNAIQRVTWSIPRARSEFFQDDVLPPTRDLERPALTADEWLGGDTKVQPTIDLMPSDMTPLSKAPALASIKSTRDKIQGPQLTDSQKREQQLDRLFQMARKDTEADDERPGASAIAAANAPDDDEW